jgi:hypothetical protein
VIVLFADRTEKEAALATGATWLAFCLALSLALPQPLNPIHLALGALAGALLIAAGFFTASRARRRPAHEPRERIRLAVLSLLSGASLGAVLLAFLVSLARIEPLLRARFAGRLSEPGWRPWALAVESSILEEVAFRLFTMSVVAWVASRLLPPGAAMVTALGVSSVLFGLAHLPAWSAAAPATSALIAAVLLLNGLGGLLLGWVFWRWGLPYAILCHLAGDIVIQSLGPRFLS